MLDAEEIGKRITIARERADMNKRELARKIQVSPSTITRYENGSFDRIKIPLIESIANALNVNPLWLSCESDSIEIPVRTPHPDLRPVSTKRLPFFDGIACGEPRYVPEGAEVYVDLMTDIQADYVLKCHGDSMTGARINDGDLVFIRQQNVVSNGEIAAVLIDDSATLKRVFWYANKSVLVLRAENPAYEDIEFSGSDLEKVRILGKAVAFQSDVK